MASPAFQDLERKQGIAVKQNLRARPGLTDDARYDGLRQHHRLRHMFDQRELPIKGWSRFARIPTCSQGFSDHRLDVHWLQRGLVRHEPIVRPVDRQSHMQDARRVVCAELDTDCHPRTERLCVGWFSPDMPPVLASVVFDRSASFCWKGHTSAQKFIVQSWGLGSSGTINVLKARFTSLAHTVVEVSPGLVLCQAQQKGREGVPSDQLAERASLTSETSGSAPDKKMNCNHSSSYELEITVSRRDVSLKV